MSPHRIVNSRIVDEIGPVMPGFHTHTCKSITYTGLINKKKNQTSQSIQYLHKVLSGSSWIVSRGTLVTTHSTRVIQYDRMFVNREL